MHCWRVWPRSRGLLRNLPGKPPWAWARSKSSYCFWVQISPISAWCQGRFWKLLSLFCEHDPDRVCFAVCSGMQHLPDYNLMMPAVYTSLHVLHLHELGWSKRTHLAFRWQYACHCQWNSAPTMHIPQLGVNWRSPPNSFCNAHSEVLISNCEWLKGPILHSGGSMHVTVSSLWRQ